MIPMTEAHSHDIVQSSPTQLLNNSDEYYPKDDDHRHFSSFHFSRKLNSGETRSKSSDKLDSENAYLLLEVPLLIIGADTIVVTNNDILGKPESVAHNVAMLKRLSGKSHDVLTGVTLVYGVEDDFRDTVDHKSVHTLTISYNITVFD
ncbi:hypothetical protein TNCV_4892211 [Trichonephila clavipes]|nr:hypothetical protein TNCV_4892211 [Trichonephila clavipes]